MENRVVWFDIPTKKIERAVEFYSQVFGVALQVQEMGPGKGAFFPFEPGVASGCLVQTPHNIPSADGVTIYLNGGSDLSVPLSKVEKAGGKVLQEKMAIGEHGYIAYFSDTEGNRIGLHSMK